VKPRQRQKRASELCGHHLDRRTTKSRQDARRSSARSARADDTAADHARGPKRHEVLCGSGGELRQHNQTTSRACAALCCELRAHAAKSSLLRCTTRIDERAAPATNDEQPAKER
jgi:hypothetical protein